MKNKFFSLLLIWTIFLVSNSSSAVLAQTVSENAPKPVNNIQLQRSSPNILKTEVKNDWQLSGSRNVLDTPVDFDKISKESSNHLPKKQQKMSGKRKAMWVAIVVGIAVGIFLLVKYAKECEIEDPNCDRFYDEYCACLKYKEKTP